MGGQWAVRGLTTETLERAGAKEETPKGESERVDSHQAFPGLALPEIALLQPNRFCPQPAFCRRLLSTCTQKAYSSAVLVVCKDTTKRRRDERCVALAAVHDAERPKPIRCARGRVLS